MRRLIQALLFLLLSVAYAQADSLVVITCGTLPLAYNAGATRLDTVDVNGNKCISGTFSASVTFPTIGAAVPGQGIYNGINVGGTLRGVTGLGLGSTFSPTVAIVDASGNQVTSFGGANASVGATGSGVPASATYVGIIAGGNLTGWTGAVTAASWPLPTGAATAANQATEIASLATIATNTGAAIPAGTALIGKVGIDQTTVGTTNGVRTIAGATGGGTVTSAIAPATPAGVNLKASAGTVFKVFATTIQSTPVYVKLYNASSAPTCGSGTPVARFMVPAAATAANGAGTNVDLGDIGAAFGTGIGYCVTGALADNDTTAITAANTLVNIVWN